MSTAPTDFEALPESDSPDSGDADPAGDPRPSGRSDGPSGDVDAPTKIPDLLDRLRSRTEQLVEEVRRLRSENRRMSARIDELDELVASSGTLLPLDAEPDELREQIEGFIDVIDERLARVQDVEEASS